MKPIQNGDAILKVKQTKLKAIIELADTRPFIGTKIFAVQFIKPFRSV